MQVTIEATQHKASIVFSDLDLLLSGLEVQEDSHPVDMELFRLETDVRGCRQLPLPPLKSSEKGGEGSYLAQ